MSIREYKKGDRVIYVGKSKMYSEPQYIGELGVVTEDQVQDDHNVEVKWAEGVHMRGVFPENIEMNIVQGKCAICELECGGTCYAKW